MSIYLKNPASCLSDFLRPYSNESENKNNVASCLWSISDRTNASTEKIYTSYESPNTQLLRARGTRAWHTHGGPTPTSLQNICIFSFWGRGGHVRLMKWKNNVLYQISLSQDPKNHWLWITVSLNHEKMFVWNASIWVGGPCRSSKWNYDQKILDNQQVLELFCCLLELFCCLPLWKMRYFHFP